MTEGRHQPQQKSIDTYGLRIFKCTKYGCDDEFDSDMALRGHIGGKHGRIVALSRIEHGTLNGYRKEVRRKMHTCQRCRDVWANYIRNRRKKIEAAASKGAA